MFAENLVDLFEQEVLGAILGESEYKHINIWPSLTWESV